MSRGEEESLAIVNSNSDEKDQNIEAVAFPFRLKSFLRTSKFSDLTIKIDACEFKVHKLIVCGQSEYFNRLFDHEWKETIGDVVELKEDDPGAIEAMIHYLYDNNYDSSGDSRNRTSPMLFNVEVYRVADKYGVAALKELARTKFDYAAKTCWDMDDFPHLISDVYNSSPCQELRETITRVSREHMEALLKKDNFLRVLNEASSFAADLVQLMAEGCKAQRYQCPNCNDIWDGELSPDTHYCCRSCGSRYSDWSSYAVSRN